MNLRVALKVLRSLPPVRTYATRSFGLRMGLSAEVGAVRFPDYVIAARASTRRIERSIARAYQRSGERAKTVRRRAS